MLADPICVFFWGGERVGAHSFPLKTLFCNESFFEKIHLKACNIFFV